ncbi:MAG: type II toxin-antitoxin system RelE/ParE family toxin, partial [Candidatus Anammoxibacter sp.]
SKISSRDFRKLKRILFLLNRASKPVDMQLPGYHLHPLKGNLKGFWSVTVNGNWRVIFKIKDKDIYDIDLIDLPLGG